MAAVGVVDLVVVEEVVVAAEGVALEKPHPISDLEPRATPTRGVGRSSQLYRC